MNNPLKYIDPSGYYMAPPAREEDNLVGYGAYDPWKWAYTPYQVSYGGDGGAGSPGDWSYDWATGTYDNIRTGGVMSSGAAVSYLLPFYLQASGAKTYTNIMSMSYINGFFQFTSSPAPTRLVSNMQTWHNSIYGITIHRDKNTGISYQPYSNIQVNPVALYNQAVLDAESSMSHEGININNLIAGVSQVLGNIGNNKRGSHPTIMTHYADIRKPAEKKLARIGALGDFYAISTSGYNIIINPSNAQYYPDFIFSSLGSIPFYGDFISLLYLGAKDQIRIRQENILLNGDPLHNTYNPATGDVWPY